MRFFFFFLTFSQKEAYTEFGLSSQSGSDKTADGYKDMFFFQP